MNHKILIVEDEIRISEIIKSYLEKEGYNIYQAFDGEKALELFKEITPNLLILDLMLPDITGEEICKNIREVSNIPIIILTAKTTENSALNGFNIGADDYITKPFSVKQLVAKVKVFLNRVYNEATNEVSINNGDIVINEEKHLVYKQKQEILITPIEYKILKVFISYKNKVFTRDELIKLALPDDFDGYDRIIDAHIKNLRQKIEINPKEPKYILTVRGIGYKFGGYIDKV